MYYNLKRRSSHLIMPILNVRNKNKYLAAAAMILTLAFGAAGFFAAAADPQTLQQQQSAAQDQKTQLEQQLKDIQDQINQLQSQLGQISSQKNTLANKIKQLQTEKNKVNLQIQQTTLTIQNLDQQINSTQAQIDAGQAHLDALHQQVAKLLVQLYENQQKPTVEILLDGSGFSDFYTELNSYQELNKNISDLAGQVAATNKSLQLAQNQLTDQEQQQKDFLSIQSLQNQHLAETISDQNTVLQQTKGRESEYQAAISDTKKRAAEIQGRIYELFGTGGKNVTFGQALQIAQYASGQTGVRAAFLLAILTQESNLGKNVGTCNRPGDPPSKSWRVVMKPDRDQQPFVTVTAELNLDPDITPVSCPLHDSRGRQIGWGGAMGPAQFIPSTWMGYKDQVSAVTGQPANPFDIRDAFIAAAIKLKADGGATQSGEWAAAMRYFSGGTNPAFRFYGDNVVATAAKYQSDIDALNQ